MDESKKTFLNYHAKVTGVQDILNRMRNAGNENNSNEKEADSESESQEDQNAKALLNKFLGAQILMSTIDPLLGPKAKSSMQSASFVSKIETSSLNDIDIKDAPSHISIDSLKLITDQNQLKQLLNTTEDFEERRLIRRRILEIMAEENNSIKLASKNFELGQDISSSEKHEKIEMKNEPMSPFAKFRELDRQNSAPMFPNSRKSFSSGSLNEPFFQFTDSSLQKRASTVKDRLLYWCQSKTQDYQNVKLDNFSSSWSDGLAFCALIHHFYPDAFNYDELSARDRRHNFTLAFKIADDKAGITPLLDVDDMVKMKKPDWKCVFTYVQSIYIRFKNED